MHVAVDLNLSWFLQFFFTALILGLGLHRLVKNTASKYFVVDATFDSSSSSSSSSYNNSNSNDIITNVKHENMADTSEPCAVCGTVTKKRCSGCKMVNYCCQACQISHWNSEHKMKCKKLQTLGKADVKKSTSTWRGNKASSAISLVPSSGTCKVLNQSKRILFPYEDFVKLFNWNSSGFPPCGLLNCGNSCFANVVLQCLASTKPLVAYLLEKGHRRECRQNDWCFMCEFQIHLEKASQSAHPFSPINILSRLPSIGGNLDHGSQEDAHEFMRFAIDAMQSVCLKEFGGEKAVDASSQETTLIQHIFGGHLQSQVICTKCNSISNQLENMMDLTVEIQGDVASLEECLDRFTAKESLHGDNMYRCDRCNDYVTAWKRLTIQLPPNILTIAFKRFQSGRFGKLNKRVTFPETLDLSPYISESGERCDIYKLFAVIVHVDMLNASFFGHYICYVKDFSGRWYKVDDCKVVGVDLEEVLSQGAYMLLYSRIYPRPTSLSPVESKRECSEKDLGETEEFHPSPKENVKCLSLEDRRDCPTDSCVLPSAKSSVIKTTSSEEVPACVTKEYVKELMDMVDCGATSSVVNDAMDVEVGYCAMDGIEASSAGLSGDFPTCTYSGEADGLDLLQVSPTSDDEYESERTKTDAYDSITFSSNKEESLVGDNCFSEKAEVPCETGHIMPASSGSLDGGGKSEGTDCPGTKLNPLFPPRFFGTSTEDMMQNNLEVLEEHGGQTDCTNSCTPGSGVATGSGVASMCCPNGMMLDKSKHFPGCEGEAASDTLSKQAEATQHATSMSLDKPTEANDLQDGDPSISVSLDEMYPC